VPIERVDLLPIGAHQKLIENGPATSGSKALSVADSLMIDVAFGASQPSLFTSAFPVASMSLA
jgi:hypothetical protein